MDELICVVGMGYIGLPTALLFAVGGRTVHGVDVIADKVKLLNHGKLPFFEPGLDKLLQRAREKGTFQVSTRVISADCYIIAVPTPQKRHKADLTYVMDAIKSISPFLTEKSMVIIESTIGPSDCDKVIYPFLRKHSKCRHLAHCPERAIPGNTLREMQFNTRIVGGLTTSDAGRVKRLYSTLVKGKIYTTNLITAAACKVMENTYRDVNIALANEFAKIASDLGFNVWEAISLANLHPRVNIHAPGPGVGGHCIAIDPWYFVGESSQTKLISASRKLNDAMPKYIAGLVKQIIREQKNKSPVIGFLGYAYKRNVDDTRETPVEPLLRLLEIKYACFLHDPRVKNNSRKLFTLPEVLNRSQIVILTTDHDEYRQVRFGEYPQVKVVLDTRNCLKLSQMGSNQQLIRLGDGRKA